MIRVAVLVGALMWVAPAEAQKWSRFLLDVSGGYLGYAALVDHGYGNASWTQTSVTHHAAFGFRADLGVALTPRFGLVAHGSAVILFNDLPSRSQLEYIFTFDPLVLRMTSRVHREGHVIGHLGPGVGFLSPVGYARPDKYIVGFHLLGMITASIYRGLGVTFALEFGAYPTDTTIGTYPKSAFFTFLGTFGLSYHVD